MLLILPESAMHTGFLSARNQSSHRLSLWLMSHGHLWGSAILPRGKDAPHKSATNLITTGRSWGCRFWG